MCSKCGGPCVPHPRRGLCNACYLAAWRAGTLPEIEQKPTKLERWLELQHGEHGCWLWTGYVDRNGYGMASVRWKLGNVPIARAAWIHLHGPVPAGLELDHLCHTRDLRCPGGRECLHRRCGNPDHVEVVTPSVNCLRREERKRRMAALG